MRNPANDLGQGVKLVAVVATAAVISAACVIGAGRHFMSGEASGPATFQKVAVVR